MKTTLLKVFFLLLIGALALASCEKDKPEAPAPPPEIVSFTPTTGNEGSTVVITGRNFSETKADNAVKFNGILATVSQASKTELTVTVPEEATTGKISVTVDDKTATSATDFTVNPLAPTITGLTPDKGDIGTMVEVYGTGFKAGAKVFFRTTEATEVAVVSKTKITAKVPTGATTGKVRVVNNGFEALSPLDFYVRPTISAFTPSTALEGGIVTITGSNFSMVPGENIVRFSTIEIPQTDIEVVSETEMNVKVPGGLPVTGVKISVEVKGMIVVSADNFTLMQPPSVNNFAPLHGEQGSVVTINGTNLLAVSKVLIGNLQANIKSKTDTKIEFYVPTGFSNITNNNINIKLFVGTQEFTVAGTFEVTNIFLNRVNGDASLERIGPACFIIGDKLYYGMGRVSSSVTALKTFKVFDLNTNTWSDGPTLPAGMDGRYYATATVYNGKAYLGSGWVGLKDWWEYDPTKTGDAAWRRLTDHPEGGPFAISFIANNKMYAGYGYQGSYLSLFNPADNSGSGSWTKSGFFGNLLGPAYFVLNNGSSDVLYFGGGSLNSSQNPQKKFNKVTFASNGTATVSPVQDLPILSEKPKGFSINNRGYVITDDNKLYEYNTTTNTWVERGFVNASSSQVVIGNNRVFLVGQYGDVREYKPSH